MERYNVAVIGAGPGGYVAAIRAAQLGLSAVIIERQYWGGVCLNVGCIPSKCLLEDTHLYYELVKHGASRGVLASEIAPDWQAMQSRKAKVVQQLTRGVETLLKKHGVVIHLGEARFKDENALMVKDAESQNSEIIADSIIIATGSRSAALPHIKPDGERVITSTEALSLSSVPKSLAVIGAGAIGLELGSVYARLGTEVCFVEIMRQALPGMDLELAKTLVRQLKKEKIAVHLESKVISLETSGTGVALSVEGKFTGTIESELVLLSVGRAPVTDTLNLDAIGVQTDRRGFIEVDSEFRTAVPNVLAIGDVIGGLMLAHKASHEGIAAAELLAGRSHPISRLVPAVVYTSPEVASIGLMEQQAVEEGHKVKVGKFFFGANGRAMAMNEAVGLVMVVADEESDEMLGVHMVGPMAGELIHEAVAALAARMKLVEYQQLVRAHPTLAEAIGEAALDANGSAIHKVG
jgi:dihydrolipoamide dehydrogenase